MAVAESPATAIGSPVARKEDPELLTGQARFVDDLTLSGMLWMAFVRSPYAHARITTVDTAKDKAGPLLQSLSEKGVDGIFAVNESATAGMLSE